MVKYSIERISLTNLRHLQTLYRAAFGKRVSLQFLSKKYNTKFTGVEFIGYLAFDQNHSPAAFYGVLPCYFRIKGEKILAAQSADTMTHPRHRREGLFLRLAHETYALAKQSGIQFIFGFPNQNSFAGFVKLNWNFQEAPMMIFRLKVTPLLLSKIMRRISFIGNAYGDYLNSKYPVKTPEVIFSGHLHDGLIKDAAFIDYKAYSKTYFIQIDEVELWIKVDSALKIGYVRVSKVTSLKRFLQRVYKIAIASGCSHAIFMTSVNTSLYEMLCGVEKPQESFPVGFYKLTDHELDFSNVQFEYCDIDIF